MTTYETLLLTIAPPFARLTLNRPAQRNAMSFQMVEELLAAFAELREQTDVRAVIIGGAGGNFCTGGDIGDLQAAAAMDEAEQDRIVARVDAMLRAVNQAPQVVIARIEGACLGGGFGLACVSDIAIASTWAAFGLPEVRLGLVPAMIAPYVIQRIGLTHARQLMLTGARFDGAKALEYGLVHEVVHPENLDARIDILLQDIRQCSPSALAACKSLLFEASKPLDETVMYRAALLNRLRRGDDGQEGMLAFMQKRPPKWAE